MDFFSALKYKFKLYILGIMRYPYISSSKPQPAKEICFYNICTFLFFYCQLLLYLGYLGSLLKMYVGLRQVNLDSSKPGFLF